MVDAKDSELTYPALPRPRTVDTILEARLAVLTYPAEPSPCVVDTKFALVVPDWVVMT